MAAARGTHGRRLAGSDTIMLEPPFQKFNSIKFASKDAAVHIKKFLATYENGQIAFVPPARD